MPRALPRLALHLLAASLLVACGGGGGPSSVSPTKIRFVNAIPDAQVYEFDVADARVPLAARQVSAPVAVDPSTSTVKVALSGATLNSFPVALRAGEVNTFVLQFTPELSYLLRPVTTPEADGAAQAHVSIVGATLRFAALDLYALAAGLAVQDAGPILSQSSVLDAQARADIPPGTYTIALTPAGSKNILFQSAPMAFAAGTTSTLIAVQRSINVRTPTAILLQGGASSLPDDARPQVRMLHQIPEAFPVWDLFVDGDLVVATSGHDVTDEDRYNLSPGLHRINEQMSYPGLQPFQANFAATIEEPGLYVQSPRILYGLTSVIAWQPPEKTSDIPVPAGVARIRVDVEDPCGVGADMRVNRVSSGILAGGTWLYDLPPGDFSVQFVQPTTGRVEGGALFSTVAGHYYHVSSSYGTAIATIACLGTVPGDFFSRDVYVSSDK